MLGRPAGRNLRFGDATLQVVAGGLGVERFPAAEALGLGPGWSSLALLSYGCIVVLVCPVLETLVGPRIPRRSVMAVGVLVAVVGVQFEVGGVPEGVI